MIILILFIMQLLIPDSCVLAFRCVVENKVLHSSLLSCIQVVTMVDYIVFYLKICWKFYNYLQFTSSGCLFLFNLCLKTYIFTIYFNLMPSMLQLTSFPLKNFTLQRKKMNVVSCLTGCY